MSVSFKINVKEATPHIVREASENDIMTSQKLIKLTSIALAQFPGLFTNQSRNVPSQNSDVKQIKFRKRPRTEELTQSSISPSCVHPLFTEPDQKVFTEPDQKVFTEPDQKAVETTKFAIRRRAKSSLSSNLLNTSKKRKRSAPIEEIKKEAQIFDGRLIEINGTFYPIQQIGQGHSHKIFAFTCNDVLSINLIEIPLNEVVLRIPLPNLAYKNSVSIQRNDTIAYVNFLSNNIPMPKCYLQASDFVDTCNIKSGGFWILEKMTEQVTRKGWQNDQPLSELTPKDLKILKFVHYWLLQTFEKKCILIPSFYDRNVMWDGDEELKIVDFCTPYGDNWQEEIERNICHWSAGNKSVEEYLRTSQS